MIKNFSISREYIPESQLKESAHQQNNVTEHDDDFLGSATLHNERGLLGLNQLENQLKPDQRVQILPYDKKQIIIKNASGCVGGVYPNHSANNLKFRLGNYQEPVVGHMSISRIIREIEASLESEKEGVAWKSPFYSSRTTMPDWSPHTDIQQNKGDPFPNCKDSPFNSPNLLNTSDWRIDSNLKGRSLKSQGPSCPVSLMNSPYPISNNSCQAASESCLASIVSDKKLSNSVLRRELELISQYELEELSADQIIEFSTRDKYVSLAFQRYLYTVWMKPVPTFTAVITKHLEVLATHQYGNYVLQVLSLRDLKIRNLVEDACRKNFLQWLGNEFSSRLLQHLLELSPSFQWFVSTQFSLKFELCRQDLSSLFVTVALIKSARDPGMLLFLDTFLQQKIQAALDNRFMRRLIVFYCEKAPENTLDLVFHEMVALFSQEKILRERTLVSILQGIMSRKHPGALSMLERLVKQRPEQLVKDGFFRFLIKKCFIFPQSIPAISESISRGMQGYLKSQQAACAEPAFLREIDFLCKFFGICLNSFDDQTSRSDFKRVLLRAASRQSLQKYTKYC